MIFDKPDALPANATDRKSKVESQSPPPERQILSSTGPASPAIAGRWKRVSAVLRDDGYLRIYSDVCRDVQSPLCEQITVY